MSKTTKIMAVLAALLVAVAPMAEAAGGSVSVSTSVNVPDVLALSVNIKNDAGVVVTGMNFGDLNSWWQQNPVSYRADISVSSSGQKYKVNVVDNMGLASGPNTIPAAACHVTPFYDPYLNNGETDPDGLIGGEGSWVNRQMPLYETNIGKSKTISAKFYLDRSLIPSDQPSGAYGGNVTFTVTAI